jgi:hypothetical protein
MAIAMESLEIGLAGGSPIPTDVIHLQRVLVLEEQSTIRTAPALPLQQRSQAGTDCGVPSSACAPLDPIAIIRPPMARDLGVPQTGDLAMGGESRLGLTGRRGGTYSARVPARPIPVLYPPCGGGGVSPACPVAELHPRALSHATKHGVTHPGARVIGPTPDVRGELVDPGRLGPVLSSPEEATKRCKRLLGVRLGRCDQGFVPQPWQAARSCAGLVGSPPLLPEVAP